MSVFKWILRLSIGERFSVFAIIFLLLFLLIIDSIFVFWFLCKLKLRRGIVFQIFFLNFTLTYVLFIDKVSLPNSYKKMRPIDDIETPTVLNDSTSQSMPNIYFSQEKTLKDSLEQSLAEVKKNAKEVKHCKSLHSIVGSRYFATKTLKCDDKSYEFIIYNGAEVAL